MVFVLCDILGVCVVCVLCIFGYDDVFYGGYVEVVFDVVCVLVFNVLKGEGEGFVIV